VAVDPPASSSGRRLLITLLAAVAAIVVAVPVGVTLVSRAASGSGVAAHPVLDLDMFTTTSGWAWAGGDDILHTTSGVQQWSIVKPPIGSLAIIEVGWVNAESARILTAPAAATNTVEQTYTLSPWITDDGGAHWKQGQPFTVLLEDAQDPTTSSNLDFVDPQHGWFFDGQQNEGAPMFIYRTVDGGLRWSEIEITPAEGDTARGVLPSGCGVYGLTFASTTTGWVAGQCGQAPLFDVTHDGGATWSPQAIGCADDCLLYAPQFTSSRDGEVFGENGTAILFGTTDGGATWHERSMPSGEAPDFIDANHGVALGLSGNNNPLVVLWITDDGGRTWQASPNGESPGTGPAETSQIDFVTPQTGWAVSVWFGNQGLLQGNQTPYPTPPPSLWQTTDAGSSWTQVTPTFANS
jgi:photosystem II stability/assembly factor-like uncharacterized protein